MKKIAYSMCVWCITVIFFASQAYATDGKISVVDDTGFELTLDAPATRIIGLDGALSELILALGQGDTLLGRTFADENIEGLKHLPVVGTRLRPNPELITSLKPQVVLQVLGRKESSALGLGLRRLGVPVLLFHLESFEDINSVLLRLGKITGADEKAQELAKSYTSRLGFLRTTLMYEARPSVFYELRYPSLLAAGAGSFITEIIMVAGGRNVVLSPEREARVSVDELVRLNPERYIVQEGPINLEPKPLAERPHFASLQAVKENKVLFEHALSFARPGPRAIDAAEKLAYWLHPSVNFSIAVPQVGKLLPEK